MYVCSYSMRTRDRNQTAAILSLIHCGAMRRTAEQILSSLAFAHLLSGVALISFLAGSRLDRHKQADILVDSGP